MPSNDFRYIGPVAVSCPDGFQWNVKAEKCYTIEIYGPINGTNLVKGCQNILPEAFPVEPRDSTQMDHIKEVTGSDRIWLGMRKPDDFSDMHDFRYYSDGKRIEYQYWIPSKPNYEHHKEYCVLIRPDFNYRWNDVRCTILRKFICQL
ncbi:hypothetical protein LSH36_554g01048 [Paralvinella palmiformis]|uniref:C-type lectin domain-containing protein n=1 Tax=Paralvinella palmiformis TaxID=53620 RepID=A0AAD9MYA0_9ANNE|nr:hypothetical protein LSH36_554g01048 [Paralvinella palmiformis]